MKIAMLTNNYKPFVDGVPISVERLSEGLRKRGHEVWIFAPEYGSDTQTDDAKENVIRFRSMKRTIGNGMVIPDMFDGHVDQIFREQKFDLIHVHHPMLAGNMAVNLSRRYEIPLVYTYHTRYEEYLHYLHLFSGTEEMGRIRKHIYGNVQSLLQFYMRWFLGKCDLVFVPSRDMAYYVQNLGLTVQVRILPTGVSDMAYEKDIKHVKEIRQKYCVGKKHLLCTVSRMEKEKNLYFLLDVVKMLKKRMGNDFRFIMAGGGQELETMEAYVKKTGLDEQVVFAGEVETEKVSHYLFASDVFLFASQSETQGIVLAEAMATGLPVAAVDACGVRDIVQNDVNGYLVEADVDVYARRLEQVLADEEYLQKLRKGARQTAENYRCNYIALQAEENYKKLLDLERRNEIYGYQSYEKECDGTALLHLFKMS